tara:strand:- start:92 stop:1375 length:1284 start_codon:yes stop_codon:yes gene_type:complete
MANAKPDNSYRRNHYVPAWYQDRFLSAEARERKYYYLDLRPDVVECADGIGRPRKAIRHLGPDSCFYVDDLYTTKLGSRFSTEIEQQFFGPIDRIGNKALDFIEKFDLQHLDRDIFNRFVEIMSLQRLRTPRGLAWLEATNKIRDRNATLIHLQSVWQMHCAIWSEAVWCILEATNSETKFIVSDNPVTYYNEGCFPEGQFVRAWGDPDIRMRGTHTIYPISPEKALVLTHLSWARNPYGRPERLHPNPNFFRTGIWKATDVQFGRQLCDSEVARINYIIKTRADRFIASQNPEWLFPERQLENTHWRKLSDSHFLMPDPRLMTFSDSVVFGFDDGRPGQVYDEYGRRPWQRPADAKKRRDAEWRSFSRFQGEYARLNGPSPNGNVHKMGMKSSSELCEALHESYLEREEYYAPKLGGRKKRRSKRG